VLAGDVNVRSLEDLPANAFSQLLEGNWPV